MDIDRDSELVYRVVCGDEDAFNELYTKYSKIIISFIYKYTKDVDLSVDIAQETFIRFLEKIRSYTYKKEGGLKNFLLTISINILRDVKKREARNRKATKEVFDNLNSSTKKDDDIRELLEDFIDSLPEREKEIILLRLDGHKIDEIAEIEKCSSRTIKRVLKKITEKMKKYFL
ncbi:MAG: RNA polymerase sigma factor [Brevinematia bacterium]